VGSGTCLPYPLFGATVRLRNTFRALWRASTRTLVPGLWRALSGDGVCPTDLSREPAEYRDPPAVRRSCTTCASANLCSVRRWPTPEQGRSSGRPCSDPDSAIPFRLTPIVVTASRSRSTGSGIGVAWGGPLAREHSMSINTEASRMLAGGPEAFAVSEIGRTVSVHAKLVIIPADLCLGAACGRLDRSSSSCAGECICRP
jgi:hypothetical protein